MRFKEYLKEAKLSNSQIEKIIKNVANKEVLDELEDFLDIEHEEKYTFLNAWEDLFDRYDSGEYSKKMSNNIQDISIKLGIYKPISDEELEKIIMMDRGKKYDFIKKGTKYIFVKNVP